MHCTVPAHTQSKRRAEVEERLANKMKEEQEALEARTGKEKARRNLRYDIIRKEDERGAYTAIVRRPSWPAKPEAPPGQRPG
jgi:hypothetical protein